jgi:hypothetical protein
MSYRTAPLVYRPEAAGPTGARSESMLPCRWCGQLAGFGRGDISPCGRDSGWRDLGRARSLPVEAPAGLPDGREDPVMPRRVESALVVVADVKDESGTEWRVGDQAPLARRAAGVARRRARTLPLGPEEPGSGGWSPPTTSATRRSKPAASRRKSNGRPQGERRRIEGAGVHGRLPRQTVGLRDGRVARYRPRARPCARTRRGRAPRRRVESEARGVAAGQFLTSVVLEFAEEGPGAAPASER